MTKPYSQKILETVFKRFLAPGLVLLSSLTSYSNDNPVRLNVRLAEPTPDPKITSTPVTTAKAGTEYKYSIQANDPASRELIFTAPKLPSWLTLSPGDAATEFGSALQGPSSVATDAAGNTYVSTIGKIYKITPAGVTTLWYDFSMNIGINGLAVDGNYLYVINDFTRDVIRLNLASPVTEEVFITGLLNPYPQDIAIRDGYLYVSLVNASQVIRVKIAGASLPISYTANTYKYVSATMPGGLGFDKSGNLFIINGYPTKVISKYDPVAQKLTEVLTYPNDVSPNDVVLDNENNLYVSFYGNGIRKYPSGDYSSYSQVYPATQRVLKMTLNESGNLVFGDFNKHKMYKLEPGISLSGTPALADIGEHDVTIKASAGSQSAEQSFTITVKGEATLSNFAAISKSYGDAAFDLKAPASTSNGAFTYSSSDITIASVNGKKVTIHKPGTVTITAKQAASGNYLESSITADLTVAAKDITLSLKADPLISKEYDGTNAATLAAANYELKDLVGTDEVTVSGTAVYDSEDAGTDKTVTVNNLVLAGKDKDKYKLTTESSTVEAEIKPKALTASAGVVTKIYDGTDKATVNFKAFKGTDGLIGQDEVSVTYTSAGYDTKHVGTQKAVTFTGLGLSGAAKANYSLNTPSITGAIELRSVTVEADADSKIYGDEDPEFTYTITKGSLADGDSFTGTLDRDPGELVSNPVYPYAIRQGTLALSSDYTLIFRRNSFNITKRLLTVKADDKEKYQGTANPALTVSYSGFPKGESKADLLTEATASTAVVLNTSIGKYDIIASGASSDNYSFDYVKGVFEVKPGHPTSISLAASTVYENQAAGTLAGTLSSTSDDPSATFKYTLVDGFGDRALFEIVGQGTQLTTAGPLNFENKSSYSVKVRSTTQHGLWLEKEFTINILNVNEQPTLADIAAETICYTTAPQLVNISGISAGPDANQSTNVTISSSNNSLFEVLEVNQAVNGQAELRYVVSKGASGSAVVNVLVTDDGGTAHGGVNSIMKSFTITVNPLPVVTISSDKGNSISKGDELVLTATGGVSYQWSNAEGILSGQNTATLKVRPSVTTTYRVTATNATNCSEVQEFTVTVNEDYQMVNGTNLVTPNGDNVNDYFVIQNLDMYPNHEVKIFDRAGRLLYSKKNYNSEWNGTFNGAPLAEDTYYYVVDFGAKKPALKGFITIVRD